jgi:hypothetical protein
VGNALRAKVVATLVLPAMLAWGSRVAAQEESVVVFPRLTQPHRGRAQEPSPAQQAPVLRMAGFGLLGGVVAGAAVAVPFYLAFNDSGCEVCTGLLIAIPAVVMAYSAGQALGVHLGNGRRGDFLADFGISLLATAAGAGLGALAGRDGALVGIVIGLAATTWTEIRTSR